MEQVNPSNERLKRRYFHELREADGLAEVTVDNAARAIFDFERFSRWADFREFRSETAIAYRKHLLKGKGKRASETNNRSTVHTKLVQLHKFFRWLCKQPGFKSRFTAGDAKYFQLSRRDRRIANERTLKPTPTLEQVKHVILCMPNRTDLEKRDRALIALILLTGIRVTAAISLKQKHVRADGSIFQDAREVRTKFGKTEATYFFPVGDDIRQIFVDYVEHLRTTLLWGESDPLFPATEQAIDDERWLRPVGLSKRHWKTSDPIRRIFRSAFEAAGLPYFTPHSLKRTLARFGEQLCRTPEEMKAWSQNLAHDDVMTTFRSYGAIPLTSQAEILRRLGEKGQDLPSPDFAGLERLLRQPEVRTLIKSLNKEE